MGMDVPPKLSCVWQILWTTAMYNLTRNKDGASKIMPKLLQTLLISPNIFLVRFQHFSELLPDLVNKNSIELHFKQKNAEFGEKSSWYYINLSSKRHSRNHWPCEHQTHSYLAI